MCFLSTINELYIEFFQVGYVKQSWEAKILLITFGYFGRPLYFKRIVNFLIVAWFIFANKKVVRAFMSSGVANKLKICKIHLIRLKRLYSHICTHSVLFALLYLEKAILLLLVMSLESCTNINWRCPNPGTKLASWLMPWRLKIVSPYRKNNQFLRPS